MVAPRMSHLEQTDATRRYGEVLRPGPLIDKGSHAVIYIRGCCNWFFNFNFVNKDISVTIQLIRQNVCVFYQVPLRVKPLRILI